MAAFELILSHARRHCSSRPSFLLRSSPSSSSPASLGFYRLLCSSSSSEPNLEAPQHRPDESGRKPVKPVAVQPVSYPRREDPSKPEEPLSHPPPPRPPPGQRESVPVVSANAEAQAWTRQDFRFVKDVPSISPVSYPMKTAPLPEDRAEVSAEEGETELKEKDMKGDEQLQREREKIEASNWMRQRVLKVEEERVPFPTLIKVEKKDKQKVIYDLAEAIRQVKANARTSFNETIEAHVKLALNMRRTDLTVHGAVKLPHGIGKAIKVAVFAEGAAADEARAAGADIVGGIELVEEIKNSKKVPDVERCISTELFMEHLKKISMVLRSLMPNPRKGTVTNDVAAAVKESKQGLIDFKMDKTAIVHVGLGKASFSEESLRENIGAFVNALLLAKPAGLKKTSKYAGYVNSFYLCSTMGSGYPVSIQSLSLAADHYNKLHPRQR